ncbi:50S ribosomal protein L21e [Candidatus Bathyarchaeota archaeon]|nr:50S ribosomal protein L21e [Candidatus Bathyarchaeota archaeon]
MSKTKGYRVKTRSLFRKCPRETGMRPLGRLLHEYNVGDKVVIMIDPAFHKGMPHRRYHGKVGVIQEKRGRAYVISLEAPGAKTVIARPEHIKPYQ